MCLMPPISVVVPLYNKAKYIEATIASAIAQTVRADEIIVVDDGSTDGSGDIVRRNFPMVRVVAQTNQGEGAARNRGLQEARNSWVALLDGDDLWLPNHLAELVGLIDDFPECVMVGSRYRVVVPDRRNPRLPTLPSRSRKISYLRAAGRHQAVLTPSATAVRREDLLRLGGFGSEQAGADIRTWLKLALVGDCARGGQVSCLYMAGRGIMQELAERSRAAGPNSQTNLDELPPSLGQMSPALGLAKERLDATEDQSLRRDLTFYINGRLAQKAKGAVRFGDRVQLRTYSSLLVSPIGPRGAFLRILSSIPAPLYRVAARGISRIKRVR